MADLSNESTLIDLENIYKNNNELSTVALERERQKLQALLIIKSRIEKSSRSNQKNNSTDNTQCQTNLRLAFYYLFLLGGFLSQMAESYLFGSTLLSLIPGLVNPWLIVASVVYTLLDSVLFYAFQARLLQDALGLKFDSNEAGELLANYRERLVALQSMVDLLPILKSNLCNVVKYHDFTQLALVDLEAIYHKLDGQEDSIFVKCGKYGVFAFGLCSNIAGSFFIAQALLTYVAPSTWGSPIGWVVTAVIILAGLAFFWAMEGRSVFQLANPNFEEFDSLKKDLRLFFDSDPKGKIASIKEPLEAEASGNGIK